MIALFDSSAWIEYFFGSEKGRRIKDLIDENEITIVLSKINIFEVYNKILKERGIEEAEKFTSFMLLKSLTDDLDTSTLKLAAQEKQKHKLGMADAIITATAIKYNAKIFTSDSDFRSVSENISIEFL